MFGKADCFSVKYLKHEAQLLHTLFWFTVYIFQRQVNEYFKLKKKSAPQQLITKLCFA